MSVEELRSMTKFRCSEGVKEALITIPSKEDIKGIFFSMPKSKAPGPDVFPVEFFWETWSVVGNDLIQAVKEFFQGGRMLKGFNEIAISLIPKVVGAEKLNLFRPISLCSTIYKVIARAMEKKLQLVVEDIVQRNQFIGWFKECTTTPTYSVIVNGEMNGHFQGKKGLRQGDPISSLLFVMAMDVLSKMLVLRSFFMMSGVGSENGNQARVLTHLILGSPAVFKENEEERLSTTPQRSDSWIWKSLCNLRHIARPIIICEVGNGNLARFWHNNWTSHGPLIDLTGPRGPGVTGLHVDAVVAEALRDGNW
ncbi:uncharacterized protein LOC106412704 [Brassica napus]|uniref:uncharacterized protein LOC106412704 n=1 Tax=Brassica napus TaxID=3708 RepID=UPI00207A4E75|nr:uncharacterized protein LOC106412704 [Brassica napus]